MINVQVEKNGNENNIGLIRRFSKKVRGSGVLNRLRRERYHVRAPSPLLRKRQALKRLAKQKEIATLVKLGKVNLEDMRQNSSRRRR